MKTVKILDGFEGTFVAGKSNRDYVLAKGDRIDSGDQQFGITESDQRSGNIFHIDGTMQNGDPSGIAMELSGEGTQVLIGKSGKVLDGQVSIVLLGEAQTLVNGGRIRSTEIGISASGAGFDLTNNGEILSASGMILSNRGTVTNNGLLDCDIAGISWTDGARKLTLGEDSVIRSQGASEDEGFAITRANATGVTSLTVNAGTIISSQFAFLSDAGNETLVNTGKITGKIDLGGGNDTFDTRGGKFTGTVDGGDGDDTYVLGAIEFNIIDSGSFADSDTLKSTVSQQLAGDFNIENLRLIGKADIDGTGGGGDNKITGNAGRNVLAGLGGNDELTGGAAKDIFVFATGDDADTIMDFDDGVDKIDLSDLATVSGFADMQNKGFISSADGNVIISDGAGEELTIIDLKIAKLDRTDFIF